MGETMELRKSCQNIKLIEQSTLKREEEAPWECELGSSREVREQ